MATVMACSSQVIAKGINCQQEKCLKTLAYSLVFILQSEYIKHQLVLCLSKPMNSDRIEKRQ